MKTIDIIIVNWNAGKQLSNCLASIEKFGSDIVSKVVVVDNASTDGSDKDLDHLDLPIEIIRNDKNRGFGAACNQGVSLCDAPYLLFLNPDAELFENSLTVPLAFMEDKTNQKVGICGIQLVDKNNRVDRSCAYAPNLLRFAAQAFGLNKIPGLKGTGVHMSNWNHLSDRKVDHVTGAFFFIRRIVFEVLNGFDERFFVYLEDVDFSFRAEQQGWGNFYLTRAQAFHEGGGTSKQVKAVRLFYSLRCRLQYGFKHFSNFRAWIIAGIILLVEPFIRLIFSLFRGEIKGIVNTFHGYRMLYADFPNILKASHKKKIR